MKTRVPVWKHSLRNRFKLRGFFRRHNKVLTIKGAIIVFLTFSVKEELRDKAREWGESLRTGEESYFMQRQLAAMTVELSQIHMQTGVAAKRLLGVSPADLSQGTFNDRITLDAAQLEALVMRERSLLFSMKELPDKERRPDAKAVGELVDTAADEAQKLTNIHGGPGIEDSPDLKAVEAKMAGLQKDANDLGSKVILEVTEQRIAFDEEYESLDALSYVLYVVGWGLALVGKLHSGGESAEAE